MTVTPTSEEEALVALLLDYVGTQSEEKEAPETPPLPVADIAPDILERQEQYAYYAKKIISKTSHPPKVPYPLIKQLLRKQIQKIFAQKPDLQYTLMILREIDLAIYEQYLREHDIQQESCLQGMQILRQSAFLELLQEEYQLSEEQIPQYLKHIYQTTQQKIQLSLNYGIWKQEHLLPLLTST